MAVEVEAAAAGMLSLASSLLGFIRRLTVVLLAASAFWVPLLSFAGVSLTVSAAALCGWGFFIGFVALSVVSASCVAREVSGSGGVGEGVLGAGAGAGAKVSGEGVGEGGAAGGGMAADVLASPLLGVPECQTKLCPVLLLSSMDIFAGVVFHCIKPAKVLISLLICMTVFLSLSFNLSVYLSISSA